MTVKRALLVIDMLNDFMAPGGALYCGDEARAIIPEVKRQITSTRRSRGAVLYVCDAHAEDDPEFDRFPSHAVEGTFGAQVVQELTPKPTDTVIEKTRLNAFYGTRLEAELGKLRPPVVHVTGVCTSICVMAAVTDLITRDYRVVVHRKAVADFDPKWRMEFWGEGYEGNMRYMYDTIRRPDLYAELLKPKDARKGD